MESSADDDLLADSARDSFLDYLWSILIDARPRPLQFGRAAEPWQWQLARELAPAAEWLAGIAAAPPRRTRFWWVLPKGHHKSGMAASLCCWLLLAARRELRGIVAAGDRDQAGVVRQLMHREKDLNQRLLRGVQVRKWAPAGPGGALQVITSDRATAHGSLPDFTVIDEPTNWRPQAEGFWGVLMANAAKKRDGLVLVIGNAGYQASWQWRRFCECRDSGEWSIFQPAGKLASWIGDAQYAEVRRQTATPAEALRLLDNLWVPAVANALMPVDWIARATERRRTPLPPWSAGVDVAYRGGDRNVIVICGEAGMLTGWELDIKSEGEANVMRVCGEVQRLIAGDWHWPDPWTGERRRGRAIPASRIRLDASDGGGAAVADRLREQGIVIKAEQFGAGADDSLDVGVAPARRLYRNRRAQLYGELARRFDPDREDAHGFSLPPGFDDLTRELAAHEDLRASDGRLMLPPKDRVKELLGGRSPDWSDALVLAAWRDQAAAQVPSSWLAGRCAGDFERLVAERAAQLCGS